MVKRIGVIPLFVLFLILGSPARGSNSSTAIREEQQVTSRYHISIIPSLEYLVNRYASALGTAFGLEAVAAFSSGWGAGGVVAQTFTMDGKFDLLFLEIGLISRFALSGSLLSSQSRTSLGENLVVNTGEISPSGLRLDLSLSKFIFNSATALSLNGVGVRFGYEFNSISHAHYGLGLRVCYLPSGDASLYLAQLIAAGTFTF